MKMDDLSRRDFIAQVTALSQAGKLPDGEIPPSVPHFETPLIQVVIPGTKDCLWSYRLNQSRWEYRNTPPEFNLDGQKLIAALSIIKEIREPRKLENETTEYVYRGNFTGHPGLSLEIQFRAADDNPIVRFRYVLRSETPRKLTKASGGDDLTYLGVSLATVPQLTEVRLSNFVELWHSYSSEARQRDGSDFGGFRWHAQHTRGV